MNSFEDNDILNFLRGFSANKYKDKETLTNEYISGKISKDLFIQKMRKIDERNNNGNRY